MTKRTTWTHDEDCQLRKMVREGLTQNQMAVALDRSQKGCSDRIRTLGIQGARGKPPRVEHLVITEPAMSSFDRMIEYGSKRLLARLIERGYWREAA